MVNLSCSSGLLTDFFLYSFCVPVPGKLENNWFNVVKGYLKILLQSALIIHRHIPKGIVVSHKNCMWVSKDKWIFKTTRCCSGRICRKLASFRCYFSLWFDLRFLRNLVNEFAHIRESIICMWNANWFLKLLKRFIFFILKSFMLDLNIIDVNQKMCVRFKLLNRRPTNCNL